MKRGLILINAYAKPVQCLQQSARMQQELNRLGLAAEIRRNDFFAAGITAEGNIRTDVAGDFCIYLDKDKYISLLLERSGMRLFNRHAAIEACDDKMTTAIRLAGHDVPMPKTLPGLLCYQPQERVPDALPERVEQELGYPLIVKTSYGSQGKGVFKVENRQELLRTMEALKCTPHIYQQYVASSAGRDMRVIVIGQRCVAAMIRHSETDFRSNLALGGRGVPATPPREVQALCEKIARLLDLDYCGIDLLFDGDHFSLCEVNSNAFFDGIEQVTQVNIARLYARHIYDVLSAGQAN